MMLTTHNGKLGRIPGLMLLSLLAGCTTPLAHQPAATTDSVLAAQYQANGRHGAITGEEAGKITDNYLRQIGVTPAPPQADTATRSGRGSLGNNITAGQ